jgi:hypothetical protein
MVWSFNAMYVIIHRSAATTDRAGFPNAIPIEFGFTKTRSVAVEVVELPQRISLWKGQ